MLLRNKPVKWWLNDNKYIKKYDFHIFTVIDSCHYAKCYHTERPPALAVKDKQIWKTRRKIQRHILKSKMAKRNDRNETRETTETTKTKRQQLIFNTYYIYINIYNNIIINYIIIIIINKLYYIILYNYIILYII